MKATELEYLRWMWQHADFGPSDGDIKQDLNYDFMEKTGKGLPEGWNYDEEGNEIPDPPEPPCKSKWIAYKDEAETELVRTPCEVTGEHTYHYAKGIGEWTVLTPMKD